MSDNIPIEIQVEIMKRLPVKSLIQFRSVSRAWKSLIDGSDFIARYSGQQHLLVTYQDTLQSDPKYVSIVDDTFPHQKVYTTLPVMVKCTRIIRGSHGLLCLYCDSLCCVVRREGLVFATDRAVLWNPSIRKAVDVVVPNVSYGMIYKSTVGFGVCPETSDPKIVKITYIDPERCQGKNVERITHIPRQVEVFTLSTGAWRSPYCNNNLPRKSIKFCFSKVTVDGFMYWLGTNRIAIDDRYSFSDLIISFDMKSEEFREINLPDSITHDFYIDDLHISKLRKSLVVLGHDEYEMTFVVWRMEDGVPNSFTKLFTICTPDTTISRVLEFRKNGEPIIEIVERRVAGVYDDYCDLVDEYSLVVYEPYSRHINSIGISGAYYSLFAYSYMETLLLLDQPGFIISDKDKES